MFGLDVSITSLKGVGEKTAAPFFDKEINTIDDLLTYLPISYISYSNKELVDGANVHFSGVINSQVREFSPKRNLSITNFTITDGNETYKFVAWNQKHLKFAYNSGDEVNVLGKYDQKRNQFTLKMMEKNKESSEGDMLVAAYSQIKKVSNIKINKMILQAIEACDLQVEQKEILLELHKPTNYQRLEEAREKFKHIEFEAYYKKIMEMKSEERHDKNFSVNIDMNVINEFVSKLPFSLTRAQDDAVRHGLQKLFDDTAMQSLVLGDVGSGKTVVSLTWALACLNDGGQVAIMLPTDILAKQFYGVVQNFLPNFASDLLVSSVKDKDKKLIKSRLETGSLQIVIGTHALTYDDVIFKNLKFVVIDEQHRFGVNQRNSLINKGEYTNYCYLSATPIPRTLAHTLYGVMDVIKINQKPANRKPIDTRVYKKSERKKMMALIESELASGNQVFVVTPLAYEVEDLNLADSLSTYESFEKYFKDRYNVGMINGQIKANSKDKIMDMFKNKEYDLLVATTVIEVGVDIPGATTIAILNGERFGLATLHQLRGRVGRNDKQGYCLVLDQSNNEESSKRLKMLEQIDDGERLAKVDYKMRGMGEVTGIRQSGSEDFILFDLQRDEHIATSIIDKLSVD